MEYTQTKAVVTTSMLTDTDPGAERVQLELFRKAVAGKKLSLVRSLSRSTIEMSRRAVLALHSAQDYVSLVYSPALADQLASKFTLMKGAEDMMNSPPDLLAALVPIIDLFEELNIHYYLGGSIASSAHGVPRATADIDLIAVLQNDQVAILVERLKDDFYIDQVVIQRAIANHGSFNLIHLETMLKVDVFVPQRDLYQQDAARRVVEQPFQTEANARRFRLASAEDIVIAKLDWFRRGGEVSDRQWSDILGVLKVQSQNLDFEYLKRWADQKELGALLNRAIDEADV
jgi:hypothetical protein